MKSNEPPTILGEATQPDIKDGATPDKSTPAEGEITIGQPVYCLAFGAGEVAAIEGDLITVRFSDTEEKVQVQQLTTLALAEGEWHSNWLRGEPWIVEDGRRLTIVKNLCRHGDWQDFLKKYDLSRSTCDDHIRRYKNTLVLAAQVAQMTGNRSFDPADLDPDRKVNPRSPDPNAEELKAKVEEEIQKRKGRVPSHHRTDWSVRIKLPPAVAAECREKYPDAGAKAYMQQAAYGLIGYVFLGKYANEPTPTLYVVGIPGNPDLSGPYDQRSEDEKYGAMLRDAMESSPLGIGDQNSGVISVAGLTSLYAKTRNDSNSPTRGGTCQSVAPQVDDLVANVIDLLRSEGFSEEEINLVQFTPSNDLNATLREAMKQLKPNAGHDGKGV
jgi:hypothetical protein